MLSQGTEEGAGGQGESRATCYGVGLCAALVSQDQEEGPCEGPMTPVGDDLICRKCMASCGTATLRPRLAQLLEGSSWSTDAKDVGKQV